MKLGVQSETGLHDCESLQFLCSHHRPLTVQFLRPTHHPNVQLRNRGRIQPQSPYRDVIFSHDRPSTNHISPVCPVPVSKIVSCTRARILLPSTWTIGACERVERLSYLCDKSKVSAKMVSTVATRLLKSLLIMI
jgi:hypothetical protein